MVEGCYPYLQQRSPTPFCIILIVWLSEALIIRRASAIDILNVHEHSIFHTQLITERIIQNADSKNLKRNGGPEYL